MDLDTLGSAPIPGDNTAGEDVRGNPEFDALQAEIDRPNDTANPGPTDWARVVKLASEITASQGKDLLVASYLAVGLIKQRQVAGFAQGLKVLRDMIVTHWDGLFPPAKRMRGRRNALQYWLDRGEELLGGLDTPPLEQAQVDAMRQHVDDIDAVLRDKDDEPPAVFKLASFIKGLPVRVEEVAAPAADTADAASGDGAGGSGGASVDVSAPTTYDEALDVVGRGLSVLRLAADYLLQADPANPLPYRIGRWEAWSYLAELPYADAGTTMVPPPDPGFAVMLENLQGAGDHASVLQYVESVLAQAPFWLDINRSQALAAEALGEGYQAVAAAIRAECALLVARVPGIEKLRFSDGQPFASRETLDWLASAPSGASAATDAPAAGNGMPAELKEAIDAAGQLVVDGDLVAAVRGLQRGIDRSPLARDRFRGRVALCKLLLEQEAVLNSWPYVRSLLDEIDRHGLDDWEPEMALAGLRLVYLGIIAAGEAAGGAPPADEILRRIARIDCTVALELNGTQS